MRKLLCVAAVLLAAPQAFAQAPPAAPPAAQTPAPAATPTTILEQILVKVNGDIVTKTELEARQIDAIRRRGQPLNNDDQLRKALAEITPDVLVDTVDELILLQRGKELGYKVTEEQFKRVLDNIRKEQKLDTDEAFTAALKQEGLDLPTLRRSLERQMIVNQVQQVEIMGKISINEDEAKRYYEEHKADFTTPASIVLRELLVAVPTDGKGVNVMRDEETQRKAEAALARLKAGEAFDKLVAELSDAPSKTNGGLVGPLQASELAPDIRKQIDPLKPGQTTGVYRTGKGYAILKLESSTPLQVMAYDTARDQIGDKIYNGKRRIEFEKYIKKLRGEAIIEWKNEEMHKLWDIKTTGADAVKTPEGGR